MVEVFKTNVQDKTLSKKLAAELSALFPGAKINFDLEDCDKILRVESAQLIPEEIALVLKKKGFVCDVLE